MLRYHMVVIFVIAVTRETLGELQSIPSPATPLNSTASPHEDNPLQNTTEDALTVGSRISLMKDLTTLKNIVVFIGIFTGVVITCLVFKVYRYGRKIRKTRKYDIITTPAERIEMAPLNEDNDDEEDSTLFDVKYR